MRWVKRRGATGAADADSLGLCGGRGLTRCGAMEEALSWAWRSGGGLHEAKRNESRRSGASPKARLLEWRNTLIGWDIIVTNDLPITSLLNYWVW